MAATGATPIILYHSTTPAAVPSNTNLAPGELALNLSDMKLYAENDSGVVTLLAASNFADIIAPSSAGNVLTSNGTTWSSQPPAPGGIEYVVKTANYTTQDKEGVLANTSGGSFTVTLPATPATGAQVVVADANGNWGTNNLTIGRNGSTIEGVAQDLICDISGVSVQLVYSGTTWEVYAQVGGAGGSVVTLDGVQTLTNKTMSYNSNTFTDFPFASTGKAIAMAIVFG